MISDVAQTTGEDHQDSKTDYPAQLTQQNLIVCQHRVKMAKGTKVLGLHPLPPNWYLQVPGMNDRSNLYPTPTLR